LDATSARDSGGDEERQRIDETRDLTLSINAITLMTHDMEASAAFYEALGLQERWRGDDPPFRTYQIGAHGALNLQGVDATTPIGTPWGRPIIYVASVDAMYARALEAGYQPESPPSDADWNERFFQIKDPAGHELAFARPLLRNPTPEIR